MVIEHSFMNYSYTTKIYYKYIYNIYIYSNHGEKKYIYSNHGEKNYMFRRKIFSTHSLITTSLKQLSCHITNDIIVKQNIFDIV